MKAYIGKTDMPTLIVDGISKNSRFKDDIVYFPFDTKHDMIMTLELLKSMGVDVE
jgi:hypothetical protein